MSDAKRAEPENLVLVYLRRIDARLDGVERKLDEVVTRLSSPNAPAGADRKQAA